MPATQLNQIATLRTRQGMTVAQLAAVSRIPAAKVRQYETGAAYLPSDHAQRLALALRVTSQDVKPLPERKPAPVFVAPAVSDDPIQAEIDALRKAEMELDAKDRWSEADRAESVRIHNALNAAYKRREELAVARAGER